MRSRKPDDTKSLFPSSVDPEWFAAFDENSGSLPYISREDDDPAANAVQPADITTASLHNSSVKFPYHLDFYKVEGLPSYQPASGHGSIQLQLRVSLFDLETARFFGKTWIGIRNSLETRQGSLGSVNVGAQDSRSQKVLAETHEDSSGASSGSESDDEGDDDDRDGDKGEGTNEVATSDAVAHSLAGRRVTINFKNECVYFHTPISSPHVIAVIEFAFIRDDDGTDEKYNGLAAGWTFFYLFDPARSGLNFSEVWENIEDDNFSDSDDAHVVPVYSGTPRILPFIAPLFMGSSTAFPSLTTIPGAALTFHFSPRPDIRPFCYLWKENIMISQNNDVPGVRFSSHGRIKLAKMETAVVSQIRLFFHPTIYQYESEFLTALAHAHQLTHRLQLGSSAPTIVERRLHIGFHNSFTFINEPIITTLETVPNEEGESAEMIFRGRLTLPEHPRGHKDVALVMGMEYKVLIPVRNAKEPEGFLKRLFGGKVKEQHGIAHIEKLVMIGWIAWVPDKNHGEQVRTIPLYAENGPNPFFRPMYSPDWYDNDQGDELDGGKPPLIISFVFNEKERKQRQERIGPPIEKPVAMPDKKLKDAMTSPIEERPPSRRPSERIKRRTPSPPARNPDDSEASVLDVYTPQPQRVHHPIVFPSPRVTALSRIEKARIYEAGFAAILDENGERLVKTVDVGQGTTQMDLRAEGTDARANEVGFCFMGITFNDNLDTQPPRTIHLTYQFYTFSYQSSDSLHVYTGPIPLTNNSSSSNHARSTSVPPSSRLKRHSSVSSFKSFHQNRTSGNEDDAEDEDECLWPGILYRIKRGGEVQFNKPPGCTQTYHIHANSMSSSPIGVFTSSTSPFAHYLAHNKLHIDVWDSDSLLYLGVAKVDLKGAMRHGRAGVIWEGEVDICTADEKPVGKLWLKITNVARTTLGSNQNIVIQNPYAVERICVGTKEPDAGKVETVFWPHKLADVDTELRNLLLAAQAERSYRQPQSQMANPASEISRKLTQVKRIRSLLNPASTDSNPPSYQSIRADRLRDLSTVTIFRARRLTPTIHSNLTNSITTTHTINASFGQGHYLEYTFKNPYNHDCTFSVSYSDDELRVVTNPMEWAYLRRVYGIYGSPRESKFLDGGYKVFLEKGELCVVPLIFQSFLSGIENVSKGEGEERMGIVSDEPGILTRVIKIDILNPTQTPISILALTIIPTPYPVTTHLRLFVPEKEQLRHIVRFSVPPKKGDGVNPTTVYDTENPRKKYIRCNVNDVVCSVDDAPNSNAAQLTFKYRPPPAPCTSSIYFLVYDDPYHTSLVEIWRCVVHSLHRLDLNCILGQTNPASLVLRGSTFSRSIRCFVDRPNEVMIMRSLPFTLTANALNEIPIFIRPRTTTCKNVVLNVVDIDQTQLLTSYLLIPHTNPPPITKSFDITLHKQTSVNKRISYTNPYTTQKTFRVHTPTPHLLQFKQNTLVLGPGESAYIGLRLLPYNEDGVVDVLVMLNDEEDRIEECLGLKIRYV